MKKIVSLFLLVVVFLSGTNKAYAQLERKSLYVYDKNNNEELRFYCTDDYCSNQHLSWHQEIMPGESKVVLVYKNGSLEKDYIVAWMPHRDKEGVYVFFMASRNANGSVGRSRNWYYYESIDVITPFPPKEIGSKWNALIADPWSYGQKAKLR